jgi:uncharacterized protein YqhQ
VKHCGTTIYDCWCFSDKTTDLDLVLYLKNTSNHSGTSVSLILSLCFIWKTPAITVVPVFHWSCPSVLSEKHQQSQWYQCFTDLVLVFYLKITSNHSGTTVFHWSCPSVLSEKHQQSQWYHSVSLILSLCFIWKTPAITVVPVFHWSCPSVLSEKHQHSQWYHSVSLILS